MATLVLGIISLATVALSFAFSFLVFAAWRQEHATRSLSGDKPEHRGGLIETAADRALTEVGQLFAFGKPGRSSNTELAAREENVPDAQQADLPPELPQRLRTDGPASHAL